MSFVDGLCEKISGDPRFAADYEAILRQSILSGAGFAGGPALEEEVLRRLLQSATIFAQSEEAEWRQLAYRISVGSLAYSKTLAGIRGASRLILARLGNYPAIKFAFKGEAEPRTLTEGVFYEILGRQLDNTVRIGERSAVLTDMQRTVWEALAAGSSLALSAPTSAGKSFVFLAYIEQLKRTSPNANLVYLVPSRALISQVAADLRAASLDKGFGVTTVPIPAASTVLGTPIYVLTPERLQVLFHTAPELRFDVAIVDEAHLIGEGARGVVLHSVLQDLQRRHPDMQFLFSSPQIREPAVFGTVVGRDSVKVVKTKDSPVAQNIILLNRRAGDDKKIDMLLWRDGEKTPLAEIDAAIPIYNSHDGLVYLSWALGSASQSLVYAAGPAACEDVAFKIKELSQDPAVAEVVTSSGPSELSVQVRKDLAAFAKEAVHPSYVLAETVEGGVGFHYGRIPPLLRSAVESAFADGHLDYIVCTSTLLQGVNLPARNVFMQNPHKGEENPIEPVDFWNLAGRAGRLGKDFQGNVFLVDYDEWESSPLSGPKDEPIKPSLEVTLTDTSTELLEYIAATDRPSGETPNLEAAFSKLLRDYRQGQLDDTFDRLSGLSTQTRASITSALAIADNQIGLNVETLVASPQISGYRQQELYDYMIKKIEEKGPDYLIPLHPSAGWKEALDKLRPVFARVHKYLELKSGQHHRYWAPLALRWMRGEPLPMIIDDAINYHKRQGKNRSNRTVIREVLTDVESSLRFKYVNMLGCYGAVLKEALTATGHASYAAKIPALTLYLELGAASQTMIQLISLGLSRHTAHVLSSLTINRDMDLESARRFLSRLTPETAGLSPYVAGELRRVLQSV
ncbi:DEAD/DEAH box helicase [Diaphorobacter nitroreducens]|uniref:DEAD/DEAH box helicase n=1 Tax=Diaphorobacter nitroreducens TaxID=164759 RepID=UPI0028AA2038|nr:DEAD/DEAH box helicase [Diaphorobacter nitroreducens]